MPAAMSPPPAGESAGMVAGAVAAIAPRQHIKKSREESELTPSVPSPWDLTSLRNPHPDGWGLKKKPQADAWGWMWLNCPSLNWTAGGRRHFADGHHAFSSHLRAEVLATCWIPDQDGGPLHSRGLRVALDHEVRGAFEYFHSDQIAPRDVRGTLDLVLANRSPGAKRRFRKITDHLIQVARDHFVQRRVFARF